MEKLKSIVSEKGLAHRISWLIYLRWGATAAVFVIITVVKYTFQFDLPYSQLYVGCFILFFYNLLFLFFFIKMKGRPRDSHWYRTASAFANVQISLDLILLTYLIHYSGGSENPFSFYYIFHIVIASIILSKTMAYIQAALSVVLFGFIVIGEYTGILTHHHLGLFISVELCCLEYEFFLTTFLVFCTTLFITVYFATSIIGELRRGEVELEQANRDLQEKDRLKSLYVQTVSHDIRSSLSTIQSCLAVVLRGLSGSVSKQSRGMIERAERRSRVLIRYAGELWKLSRMRLTDKVEMSRVPIFPVISNVIERIKPSLTAKRLVLEIDDAIKNVAVYGNDFMLEKLFLNLLDNATQYTPGPGRVEIACTIGEDPEWVNISIRDTGIGIPAENISQIFDDFFRAENAKHIEKIGSGLGLAICKRIVEIHGGNIWVSSVIGEGSTFVIPLPRKNNVTKEREVK